MHKARDKGIFFLFLISLILLAACGGTATTGQSDNQEVTLRLEGYNYGSVGTTDKGPLIEAFEKAYPHIHILPKSVPAANGVQVVTSEAAAGNLPDIAQLPFTSLNTIVKTLEAQAIDKIAPQNEYTALMQHVLPAARLLGRYDGHLYGSPFTVSTPTLFYNATIFRAAGLDPKNPPATWELVRADAEQIKARTGKFAIFIGQEATTDWQTQSLLASNGATTLSEDGAAATFNQPNAIAVFQMWQGLVKAGVYPKISLSDAEAAMSNGDLGMMLFSTALLPLLQKAAVGKYELSTASEPAFGTKSVVPVNSGSALFVFSKDSARQQAAWKFLNFAASQEGYTLITSKLGYIPLRDDVLNDSRYLKPYIEKNPLILPAIAQLNHLQARVPWPGNNSAQAVNLYIKALFHVVYDGQDAQKTMDAAAAQINVLLTH